MNALHDLLQRLRTPNVDPHAVADTVFEQMTREERDEVLRYYLPQLVTDYYRNTRLSLQRNFRNGQQPPSTKASRVSDWYQQWLEQPVFVASGWKLLSSCTLDDILYLAEDRHRRADELRNEANRWDACARVMKDTEAQTVSDVPEADLRDAFS